MTAPVAGPRPLIDCRAVHYRYDRWNPESEALSGISWQVPPGSVMALIGPNGAGKSTLLNILLGLHPPTSGHVEVLGYTPWRDRARLTADVTFVSDVASLPKWIKVRDLSRTMKSVHPRFRSDYFAELLDHASIPDHRECGSFSKGQLTYIHLSLSLAVDARLLILDEPTLGLDVAARRYFHTRLLVDYCRGGRSLVVTTHYPDELIGLVTHAAYLAKGKLRLADTVERLSQRYQVVKVRNALRERAEAFRPLYQQAVLGGTQMLFELGDSLTEGQLEELGSELSGATLSDIYLALLEQSDTLFSV